MSKDNPILTTKDFTILEAMRDNRLGTEDPLTPILRRKLGSALVVFAEDLPETVASLNSRVTFTVNGGERQTRALVLEGVASVVGMSLSITTLRGMALLGLAEGDECVFSNRDGLEERILLEKVHYQPQASQRRGTASAERKPLLTLVRGGRDESPRSFRIMPGGHDDPGPSAA
nr:nucleoside-diphosphate kinase [Rhizobium sp. Q54]